MKAFALKRYSKSNGVDEVDVSVPQLRDGDVLVQVCAASVNPLDLKIRHIKLTCIRGVGQDHVAAEHRDRSEARKSAAFATSSAVP